jgi:hypothetical protein
VNASAKCDVTPRVWTHWVERVGLVELIWVPVGGAVEHHQGGAGRNVDAANGACYPRQPEVTLDRALDPKRFLDEVRHAVALTAQQLLDVGALREDLQRGAQQAHRCLLPG